MTYYHLKYTKVNDSTSNKTTQLVDIYKFQQ